MINNSKHNKKKTKIGGQDSTMKEGQLGKEFMDSGGGLLRACSMLESSITRMENSVLCLSKTNSLQSKNHISLKRKLKELINLWKKISYLALDINSCGLAISSNKNINQRNG